MILYLQCLCYTHIFLRHCLVTLDNYNAHSCHLRIWKWPLLGRIGLLYGLDYTRNTEILLYGHILRRHELSCRIWRIDHSIPPGAHIPMDCTNDLGYSLRLRGYSFTMAGRCRIFGSSDS